MSEGDSKVGAKKESEYYEMIRAKLEDLLRTRFNDCHLEITADKKFSNTLKAQVSEYREIVFSFLKEAVGCPQF